MIIISKHKDYYDYLPHIYGVDNSIVYDRRDLESGILITENNLPRLPYQVDNKVFKWLVVCGYSYILVGSLYEPDVRFSILDEDVHPELWKVFSKRRLFFDKSTVLESHGKYHESVVGLSRRIGQPVFTYGRYYTHRDMYVDKKIPVLDEYKFSKIKSPEKIYQEISYFICNMLKESPDLMIQTKMNDIEKVVSHGFDKKISFRHRKD